MSRKRLSRMIGKTLPFSAKMGKISYDGKSICMVDIKHKGKNVADHVWVSYTMSIKKLEAESYVRFKGTVHSYVCKKGERKCGIRKTHDFELDTECSKSYMEDREAAAKRRGKVNGVRYKD